MNYPDRVPICPGDLFVNHMKIHNTIQADSKYIPGNELFIIDTWSDLVHQCFSWHGQEKFICNYCDLSQKGKRECKGVGRLPLEAVRQCYKQFAEYVTAGDNPASIVFIDFPAVFDSRAPMRQRSAAITQAILSLEATNLRVRLVTIPYNSIERRGGDQHPYHFADGTVHKYSAELDKVLISLFPLLLNPAK